MSDVMIYAQDLSKRFGGFHAVNKINFEVRRGEVVGFLGPNGAGKSTTMRILTCFLSPTDGTAKVNGFDVFDSPLGVRRSLGYLPQRAPLYLEMGVLEYLKFAAGIRQLDDSTFQKRARSVVEVCGLAKVLGREIQTLSHGYRQRVGLAQALIHDPPILILDEPTSGLDPNETAEFLEYLKRLGNDRTVLISTHNLSEVEAACARAIIISQGKIAADGPLDEIRARSGKVRYVISVQEGKESAKAVEIENTLKGLRGAKNVVELPTDEKAHTFELASETESDLRAEIFQMAVQKGWVLLELHRDTQTLEDVFRNLTVGDARRNRELGASSAQDDEEDYSDDEEDEDDSKPTAGKN